MIFYLKQNIYLSVTEDPELYTTHNIQVLNKNHLSR